MTLSRLRSIFFYVLLTELCLGGGRLISWGPVSLRMVLFAIAMIITVISFARGRRISRDYQILVYLFLFMICIGLVVGLISRAKPSAWWEDIKPLLYFLILPFFVYSLEDNPDAIRSGIPKTFKIAGIAQAISFIILLFLIHGGVIPFQSFYWGLIYTGELFFRGEISFVYKGFIFFCVAFLFIDFTGGRRKWIWESILIFAIILTIT